MWKPLICLPLSIIILVLNIQVITGSGPIVETKVGLIQGLHSTDGNYSMFLGIPYGQVNGANPFGNLLPQPKFEDVFQADDDTSVCAQVYMNGTLLGVRDCLHLNIYVPDTASTTNRLPVMIWIHGGAFVIGFKSRSLYGEKFLVRHDVILVSINYRLGPYGFMCLDIPEVPGNQALKDQQKAFKWVYDNIEAFGGDVNKITLFGESAGAMAIDLHLRSKAEKLYSNVIMLSGSSMRGMILVRKPDPTVPIQIAEQLGFITSDIYEALNYLSGIDPLTLIVAASRTDIEFRPCVETQFENIDNFITDFPMNIKPEKAEGMPILMGYNNDEQVYVYAHSPPSFFETTNLFHNRLHAIFDFEENKLSDMERIVRQFYLADEEISYLQRKDIISFDSDIVFNIPAQRSADVLLENEVGDLYFYLFSYHGGRNLMRHSLNITIGGISHSDGLGYLFDSHLFPDTPASEDQLVLDRMTTMWTNFAKYGNPTPTTTNLLPVKWEPIVKDSPHHYMDINFNLSIRKKPFHKRMAFWKVLYDANAEYERGYRRPIDENL